MVSPLEAQQQEARDDPFTQSQQRENEVQQQEEEKHLSLMDLVMIGVGGTIGSGIFVLTGYIAHHYSGKHTWVSFLLSGLASVTSGIGYAELSGKFPRAGSTYYYAQAVLSSSSSPRGVNYYSIVAAACLTLEYAVSGAAIARSWGDKVALWLWEETQEEEQTTTINWMACLLSTICTCILLCGVKESKQVTNFFTIAKVLLVVFMIFTGFTIILFYNNNTTNHDHYHHHNVVLLEQEQQQDTTTMSSPLHYYHFGISGIVRGATSSFFGYLGYDEICCLAGEAIHPRKDMPRAVLYTLAIITLLYILASVSLTGMYDNNNNYDQISDTSPFPQAFHQHQFFLAAHITAIGEIFTLPIVVLIALMAQPRLFYAMSIDGYLPKLFSSSSSLSSSSDTTSDSSHDGGASSSLWHSTLFSGIGMTIIATFIPFGYLDDFISVGILLVFCITNSCLIVMRCSSSNCDNTLNKYNDNTTNETNTRNQNTISTTTLDNHTTKFNNNSTTTKTTATTTVLTLEQSLLLYNGLCFVFSLLCRTATITNNNAFDPDDNDDDDSSSSSTAAKIKLLSIFICGCSVIAMIVYMSKRFPPFSWNNNHDGNDNYNNNSNNDHCGGDDDGDDDDHYFETPLVPFLPCLGLLINWYLISQLEFLGLILLSLYIGIILGIYYFCYYSDNNPANNSNSAKDNNSCCRNQSFGSSRYYCYYFSTTIHRLFHTKRRKSQEYLYEKVNNKDDDDDDHNDDNNNKDRNTNFLDGGDGSNQNNNRDNGVEMQQFRS